MQYAQTFPLTNEHSLDISIFSKHLQFLKVKDAAEIALELGFNGLDLTVRPGGHIAPEEVTEALPQAVKAIKNAGSQCKMITTAITSANNETDKSIIRTAGALGVEFYRANWFSYHKNISMEDSLKHYQTAVANLAVLNKKHGIVGCYHNHSGRAIGASYWEVKKLLQQADPDYFGAQYDIRHAVVEGGYSWKNGFELLKNHIKTIVLKDFKWVQHNGKWRAQSTPIGEGMVDFTTYFKMLKNLGISPPVSLHMEYDLGGAQHGGSVLTVDKKVVFDAMKKDLNTIKELWKNA